MVLGMGVMNQLWPKLKCAKQPSKGSHVISRHEWITTTMYTKVLIVQYSTGYP